MHRTRGWWQYWQTRFWGVASILQPIMYQLVSKYEEIKIKTLTDGPNNASGIVCAHFCHHLLHCCIFCILQPIMYQLESRVRRNLKKKHLPRLQMTRMVSFVPDFVMATFHVLHCCIFHILEPIMYQLVSRVQRILKKDPHQGPKRHVWRRLGLFPSLLPSPLCTTYNVLVSIKNMKEIIKKHSPRAQTTHLALFGPIFVVAAFHLFPYLIFRSLKPIYEIKHQLASKIQRKKKLT